jgi:hypothetical protein
MIKTRTRQSVYQSGGSHGYDQNKNTTERISVGGHTGMIKTRTRQSVYQSGGSQGYDQNKNTTERISVEVTRV